MNIELNEVKVNNSAVSTTVAELLNVKASNRLHKVSVSQPFEMEEAKRMLELYRDARERRVILDRRDQVLENICAAIVDGYRLLEIDKVIRAHVVDSIPRLAFAPIGSEIVHFHFHEYYSGSRALCLYTLGEEWFYRLEATYLGYPRISLQATVPMVPIEKRPSKRDGYCILWEPEWEVERRRSPSRADPLLIKRVHDNIYALVDWWDPSEMEIYAITSAD